MNWTFISHSFSSILSSQIPPEEPITLWLQHPGACLVCLSKPSYIPPQSQFKRPMGHTASSTSQHQFSVLVTFLVVIKRTWGKQDLLWVTVSKDPASWRHITVEEAQAADHTVSQSGWNCGKLLHTRACYCALQKHGSSVHFLGISPHPSLAHQPIW